MKVEGFSPASRGGVWGGGKSIRRGTPLPRSRKTEVAADHAVRRHGSLLITNLRLKEVCIRLPFVGRKISRPDLAGSGVNNQAVIPSACDLVTSVSVARGRSRDTERDEDANA